MNVFIMEINRATKDMFVWNYEQTSGFVVN
jgi:hypothetical protein